MSSTQINSDCNCCCAISLASIPIITIASFWLLSYIRRSKRKCNLKGKTVLITGATSGIGEALAYQLLSRGASVIVSGRNETKLASLKAALVEWAAAKAPKSSLSPSDRVATLCCDLETASTAELETAAALAFEVAPSGRLDVLINNAGISYRGGILATKPEMHERLMRVDYLSQVTLTRSLLLGLKERWNPKEGMGQDSENRNRFWVVGISSVQGRISTPYRAPYCAAKHAFQAFHDCIRAEFARPDPVNGLNGKVDVLVVSPGYVRTAVSKNALTASGASHGVTDETHASAVSAEEMARSIVRSLERGDGEATIAVILHRFFVHWIRPLMPELYFIIAERLANSPTWVRS